MASAECGWGEECCKRRSRSTFNSFWCFVDSPKNCKDCVAPQGSAVSRLGNMDMDGLVSLWQNGRRVVRYWDKYVDIKGFNTSNIMITILSNVTHLCSMIKILSSILHLCSMIKTLSSVLHFYSRCVSIGLDYPHDSCTRSISTVLLPRAS